MKCSQRYCKSKSVHIKPLIDIKIYLKSVNEDKFFKDIIKIGIFFLAGHVPIMI